MKTDLATEANELLKRWEALCIIDGDMHACGEKIISILRRALPMVQAFEREPVAWMVTDGRCNPALFNNQEDAERFAERWDCRTSLKHRVILLYAPPENPK